MWTFWPPANCHVRLQRHSSSLECCCCYLCNNCCCREFQLEIWNFHLHAFTFVASPCPPLVKPVIWAHECNQPDERTHAHECACAVYEMSTSVHIKCSRAWQAEQPATGHFLTPHSHTKYRLPVEPGYLNSFCCTISISLPVIPSLLLLAGISERFSTQVFHLHCTYLPLC